jgi:hypothetical protein
MWFNGSGGIASPSVNRMVGPNASEDIRKQQLVWNIQSQTPTILRILHGAKPMTREEWHDVKAPTLIIVGEEVLRSISSLIFRIKFVLRLKEKRFEHGFPLLRSRLTYSLFRMRGMRS